MSYLQRKSSTWEGVKCLFWAGLIGVFFCGLFYYGVYEKGLLNLQDKNDKIGTVFRYIVVVIWFGGVTLGVLIFLYLGLLQINSNRSWLVSISNEVFCFSAPNEKVAKSFSLPLRDILEIIIEKDEDSHTWYVVSCDGIRHEVSINSPLRMKGIKKALLRENPEIGFRSIDFVKEKRT